MRGQRSGHLGKEVVERKGIRPMTIPRTSLRPISCYVPLSPYHTIFKVAKGKFVILFFSSRFL